MQRRSAPPSLASFDLPSRAKIVADRALRRATELDRDGEFPADDLSDLHAFGFLEAPFPAALGGVSLGTGKPALLRRVLTTIGSGSLVLGRLFEGHVNAIALVERYGTFANLALLRKEAQVGRLSGVWMAGEPLRFHADGNGGYVVEGRKLLCSGAGTVRRPLVAGDTEAGSLMAIPSLRSDADADMSQWTAHGMRASATGTVDFSGIGLKTDEIVGQPGDYLRSPFFRGGAWRVLAVQLGGVEALLELYRQQLAESAWRDHPIQLARFGQALIAAETARLWVQRASEAAEGDPDDCDAIDATVDLARNAFETAALSVIALAQKAIGLKAFLRPNPIERIARDLATYLRQPALDASLLSAASHHLRRQPGQLP